MFGCSKKKPNITGRFQQNYSIQSAQQPIQSASECQISLYGQQPLSSNTSIITWTLHSFIMLLQMEPYAHTLSFVHILYVWIIIIIFKRI